MKTNYELRYAAHPEDAKQYDTKRIRRDFLIETVFAPKEEPSTWPTTCAWEKKSCSRWTNAPLRPGRSCCAVRWMY